MEIIYIWIKNSGIIKNVGFNFWSPYIIEYDDIDGNLEISENKDFIDSFYSKKINLNITSLIGQNGSGKSTLLKSIIEVMSIKTNEEIILGLFNRERKINIYSHKSINININNKEIDVKQFDTLNNDVSGGKFGVTIHGGLSNGVVESLGSEIVNTLMIYYNNAIYDMKEEYFNRNIKDISLGYYLQDCKNRYDSLSAFYNIILENQISMLGNKKFNTEIFPMPKKVKLIKKETKKHLTDNLDNWLAKLGTEGFGDSKILYEKIYNIKDEIYSDVIINIWKYLNKWENFIFLRKKNNYEKRKEEFKNGEINIETIENYIRFVLYEVCCQIRRKKYEINRVKIEEAIDYGNDHEEAILKPMANFLKNNLDVIRFLKKYNNSIKNREYLDKEIVFPFALKYFYSFFNVGYIFFEWDYRMSSGEEQLLDFFGRLYNAIENKSQYQKDIIILLDEPEIYLHPEWQRNFMKYFITFLEEIINDKEVRVQVIITSHSPLIISDFMKNNTIFLKNDNERCVVEKGKDEIFASNIHTLFAKSFFLNITIGEFAKEKINDIINKLSGKNKLTDIERRELKKIINSIGEPLVKNSLIGMYKERFSDENEVESIEQEIKELKKRIEQLKRNKK